MPTTLLQFVEKAAEMAGLLKQGTLTAIGTTTTITDASLRIEDNDALQRAIVVMTSGTSSGLANWRKVSTNARSTGILTIFNTWASTPANSATYDVFLPPLHPVEHIKPAVNMVLAEEYPHVPTYLQTRLRVPLGTTRLAVPTTYRSVEEVLYQGGPELLANEDWRDGTTGWTLGASHVLANTGDDQDRVLSVPNTNVSYQDVAVTGGVDYEFSMLAENNGTLATQMIIQWMVGATQIGSDVTIGSVTATTKTRIGSTVRSPINADTVRVRLTSDGSGTGKVYYAAMSQVLPWIALPFAPRRDGVTRYVEFPGVVRAHGDVLFSGPGIATALSADADSVTIERDEVQYICAKTLAKAFAMLGAADRSAQETRASEVAFWEARARGIRRSMGLVRPRVRNTPLMAGYG